jgi:predicted transglutaminase-like cysteine proteinase
MAKLHNSIAIKISTIRTQWLLVLLLCSTSLLLPALVIDGLSFSISEKQLTAIELRYKVAGRKRVTDWLQMVTSNQDRTLKEKLALVNDFFNQSTVWVSDYDHYGKQDYWATPLELLASGGGDCEDFAIGKYFTLLALKVPMDTLKITYVKAKNADPVNQSHMVLTYFSTPSAMPLVLDNLNQDIRSASERSDLTPVYSFNGQGLWIAKERSSGKSIAGGSSGISLWRSMLLRMGHEFE